MLNLHAPDLKITVQDEIDFYTILRQSPTDRSCFENHWPYIIQATRARGFVYKHQDTRIYYYFRDTKSVRELVVVNMLGSQKESMLAVFKECAMKNQLNLCVKNIPVAEIPHWQTLGFCEKKEPWSQFSVRDDNSFPECIYDLETLARAHEVVPSGHKRQCRASHAQGLRKFLRERDIQLVPYDRAVHKDAIYQMLLDNAQFLENKGVDSKQNVIDAHLFVFEDDVLYKERLVSLEHGHIVGFNYITVFDDALFGNALIHKNQSGLMRFLIWQGFNYLYNQLDKNKKYTVTFQGSEKPGQYHWKRGFAPLREIHKIHITDIRDQSPIAPSILPI